MFETMLAAHNVNTAEADVNVIFSADIWSHTKILN